MKTRTRVASPTVLAAERRRQAGETALWLLQGLVNRAYINKDTSDQHQVWAKFYDLASYGSCCACLAKADEADNDMGSGRVKLVRA